MCSRKWLMPLSSGLSKREPTRTQSDTWARCNHGWGETITRNPFSSVALVWLVLILVFGRSPCAAVDLGLGDVRIVDLQVVLGGGAETLDIERHRLVALGAHELLLEGRPIFVELLASRGLSLPQAHDGESIRRSDGVGQDGAFLCR